MTIKTHISRVMACAGGLLLAFGANAKVVVALHPDYSGWARYAANPFTEVLFEKVRSVSQCQGAPENPTSIEVLAKSQNSILQRGADPADKNTKLTIVKPWHLGGKYPIDANYCHITVRVNAYRADGTPYSKTCHAYAVRTGDGGATKPFRAECE